MDVAAAEPVPNLSGAALTVVVAILTYLGTRKPKADQAAALVEAATKLATAATATDGASRVELADLRAEVASLADAVADCEQKHQRAEAALLAAGIPIP